MGGATPGAAMGLFDFFLSDDKKIARHVRRLTNRDSQEEDRHDSAIWLANNGSPQAVLGLFQRFDLLLEHSVKDGNEKDHVVQLLENLGAEATREPVRVWLRKCKQVARPLGVLERTEGRQAAVDMAFELLRAERERDDFKPAKKKALLIWLAEARDPRMVDEVVPFLHDFDGDVRYAAAEVLFAQQDAAAAEALWRALVHPEEESNRLKIRIAEVFVQRRWPVGEHPERVAADEALSGRFRVVDGRLVA